MGSSLETASFWIGAVSLLIGIISLIITIVTMNKAEKIEEAVKNNENRLKEKINYFQKRKDNLSIAQNIYNSYVKNQKISYDDIMKLNTVLTFLKSNKSILKEEYCELISKADECITNAGRNYPKNTAGISELPMHINKIISILNDEVSCL